MQKKKKSKCKKGVRNFQFISNLSHVPAVSPFLTVGLVHNPLQSQQLKAKLAESVHELKRLPQSVYRNQKLLFLSFFA